MPWCKQGNVLKLQSLASKFGLHKQTSSAPQLSCPEQLLGYAPCATIAHVIKRSNREQSSDKNHPNAPQKLSILRNFQSPTNLKLHCYLHSPILYCSSPERTQMRRQSSTVRKGVISSLKLNLSSAQLNEASHSIRDAFLPFI